MRDAIARQQGALVSADLQRIADLQQFEASLPRVGGTGSNDRAMHTGTQLASTISDFSEALDDRVAALLVAGANITLTYNDAANTLTIVASGGAGSGIVRSVSSISAPTTAGAAATTDYVYFVSGTTTLTLPTAVGNTNSYEINNDGAATVTVACFGAQTINGSATITLAVNDSVELLSNNANWKAF